MESGGSWAMRGAPNLPGFVRNRNPSPGSLGRKQGFCVTLDGVMLESTGRAPHSATRTLSSSITSAAGQIAAMPSARATKAAPVVPDTKRWLTLEGMVLQFEAQFTQSMAGMQVSAEVERTRDVIINFYLVDDTVEIIEQKQSNSGIPQGTIVRRSKVSLPGGAALGWRDLAVGAAVTVYGITYNVIDCNASTRAYLERNGISCAPARPRKRDAYLQSRETAGDAKPARSPIKQYIEASLGNTTDLTTRQAFLDYGTSVLSFDAVWDRTEITQGEEDDGIDPRDRVVRYVLNYHLASDCVEILENHEGDGHDRFPCFLSKQKLPKGDAMQVPWGRDDQPAGSSVAHLHWRDLAIGGTVRVFGRNLKIVRADASTRRFYEKYGLAGDPPRILGPDIEVQTQPAAPVYEAAIPPPTGFGSEEDSLASWRSIVPKAPKTAFELCKGELDPTVLRFTARMRSDRADDGMRRFKIMYFFADKTAMVVETPVRNSGFTGGTFLSRGVVTNGLTDKPLQPQDLFVGGSVRINCFDFTIVDADPGTLKYCEAHPDQFPLSAVPAVLDMLRDRMWSGAGSAQLEAGLDAEKYRAQLRGMFADVEEQAIITVVRNIPSEQLAGRLAGSA